MWQSKSKRIKQLHRCWNKFPLFHFSLHVSCYSAQRDCAWLPGDIGSDGAASFFSAFSSFTSFGASFFASFAACRWCKTLPWVNLIWSRPVDSAIITSRTSTHRTQKPTHTASGILMKATLWRQYRRMTFRAEWSSGIHASSSTIYWISLMCSGKATHHLYYCLHTNKTVTALIYSTGMVGEEVLRISTGVFFAAKLKHGPVMSSWHPLRLSVIPFLVGSWQSSSFWPQLVASRKSQLTLLPLHRLHPAAETRGFWIKKTNSSIFWLKHQAEWN